MGYIKDKNYYSQLLRQKKHWNVVQINSELSRLKKDYPRVNDRYLLANLCRSEGLINDGDIQREKIMAIRQRLIDSGKITAEQLAKIVKKLKNKNSFYRSNNLLVYRSIATSLNVVVSDLFEESVIDKGSRYSQQQEDVDPIVDYQFLLEGEADEKAYYTIEGLVIDHRWVWRKDADRKVDDPYALITTLFDGQKTIDIKTFIWGEEGHDRYLAIKRELNDRPMISQWYQLSKIRVQYPTDDRYGRTIKWSFIDKRSYLPYRQFTKVTPIGQVSIITTGITVLEGVVDNVAVVKKTVNEFGRDNVTITFDLLDNNGGFIPCVTTIDTSDTLSSLWESLEVDSNETVIGDTGFPELTNGMVLQVVGRFSYYYNAFEVKAISYYLGFIDLVYNVVSLLDDNSQQQKKNISHTKSKPPVPVLEEDEGNGLEESSLSEKDRNTALKWVMTHQKAFPMPEEILVQYLTTQGLTKEATNKAIDYLIGELGIVEMVGNEVRLRS